MSWSLQTAVHALSDLIHPDKLVVDKRKSSKRLRRNRHYEKQYLKLGAAFVLATQGWDLAKTARVMLSFSLGAALPLVLGIVMISLSVLILSGADKSVEAWLVAHSPAALTRLTTAF